MTYDSDYMILSADVLNEKQKIIPAVTHVDGTARVQTVKKNINGKFWSLINEFIFVMYIILNTSLMNELVCHPKNIECFLRTELDLNFLIHK